MSWATFLSIEVLRDSMCNYNKYDAFTKSWNLVERKLQKCAGGSRVEKLKNFGNTKPEIFQMIDKDLLKQALLEHCVYDEAKKSVKSYVRDSFAVLRENLDFNQLLCHRCPSGINCSRKIGNMDRISPSSALLLISYQIRSNRVHLGKFEETPRNKILQKLAIEVFKLALSK